MKKAQIETKYLKKKIDTSLQTYLSVFIIIQNMSKKFFVCTVKYQKLQNSTTLHEKSPNWDYLKKKIDFSLQTYLSVFIIIQNMSKTNFVCLVK